MAFDSHKNFAYSTVAVAPSPALSGLTLTVQAGDGAKFGAAPFNVVVCPFGVAPIVANAEISRVTNVTGDVFTLLRQQETGPNRAIQVGDQIFMAYTAKSFTDIEAALALLAPLASPALTGVPTAPTAAPGTNTTQLATTAFSAAAISVEATARSTADALLAPLASPALTGVPTGPTAAAGTNTTQLATTAFALAGDRATVVPVTTTGAQNNWNPGLGTNNTIFLLSNTALLTISGIAAGFNGQIIVFLGTGGNTGQTDFLQNSGLSLAANRMLNKVGSGPTSIAPVSAGCTAYMYDGGTGVWRCFFHDQGTWMTPAFAAGNFTGNGAMTWTVTSGNISRNAYQLIGKTLHWAFDIGVTTIGGTLNTSLQIVIPGGFTVTGSTAGSFSFVNGNGVTGTGTWAATGTSMLLRVDRSSAANWAAGANAIVTGVALFEIN